MEQKHPTISIVVPIYNEISTIDMMMQQLKRLQDQAEIVFVDGGSCDGTPEHIESQSEFRVIRSGRGRGHQLNAGAANTSGDVLFFLHCDCILPADALDQIYEVLKRSEYGCFGLIFQSHNFFMWTNTLISNDRAFRRGRPFGDQGVFMTRRLFEEFGGYEEISLMEDVELSARMRAKGLKPAATRERLLVSPRRYRKGTIGILKTEYQMWHLRQLFYRGEDPTILNKMYGDIRKRGK